MKPLSVAEDQNRSNNNNNNNNALPQLKKQRAKKTIGNQQLQQQQQSSNNADILDEQHTSNNTNNVLNFTKEKFDNNNNNAPALSSPSTSPISVALTSQQHQQLLHPPHTTTSTKTTTVTSSSVSSSSSSTVTIKVNELLENTLGLSMSSLNKLDAKTFDHIMLSALQPGGLGGQARKIGVGIRASAKFGSGSRHVNRRVGSAFMAMSPQQQLQQQLLQHEPQDSNGSDVAKRFVAKKSFLTNDRRSQEPYGNNNNNINDISNNNGDDEDRVGISSGSGIAQKLFFVPQKAKKSMLPSSQSISQFSCDDQMTSKEDTGDYGIRTRQSYKRKCSLPMIAYSDDDPPDCKRRSLGQKRHHINKMKALDIQTSLKSRGYSQSSSSSSVIHDDDSSKMSIDDDHFAIITANSNNNNNITNNNNNTEEADDVIPPSNTTTTSATLLKALPGQRRNKRLNTSQRICCCSLPGLAVSSAMTSAKLVVRCQAVDSFDGRMSICNRRVVRPELRRVSKSSAFIWLCEEHRLMLSMHHCCPSCGHFCTQGSFFECRPTDELTCNDEDLTLTNNNNNNNNIVCNDNNDGNNSVANNNNNKNDLDIDNIIVKKEIVTGINNDIDNRISIHIKVEDSVTDINNSSSNNNNNNNNVDDDNVTNINNNTKEDDNTSDVTTTMSSDSPQTSSLPQIAPTTLTTANEVATVTTTLRTSAEMTSQTFPTTARATTHRYHKNCHVISTNNTTHCPHCFKESNQQEINVYNIKLRPLGYKVPSIQSQIKLNSASSINNANDDINTVDKNTDRTGIKSIDVIDAISENINRGDNGGGNGIFSDSTSIWKSTSARIGFYRKGDADNKIREGSVCSESMASTHSNLTTDEKVDYKTLLITYNVDSSKFKKIRPTSKALCSAVKSGDLNKTIYILSEGVDPALSPDDSSQPPLLVASYYGHFEIVDFLLNNTSVSVDSIDQDLHTSLMEVSQTGHLSILKLLIDKGATVNARAQDGMTAMHFAAKHGQIDVLKQLLDTEKVDVNVKDDGGWTPLIWAIEHNQKECILFLMNHGADPKIRDNEMNTALHWSAYTGNQEVSVMFLEAGCILDDANEHGDTPMHIAARQDHLDCIMLFMGRKAKVNLLNNAGHIPLQCCPDENCLTARHLKLISSFPVRAYARTVCRDISKGRELRPIMVINHVDDEVLPNDFIYISGYVETSPINVNKLVTSLKHCKCSDNCTSSSACSCSRASCKRWYDNSGRLTEDFNYLDPPLIYECNILCICDSSCHNRVIQSGTINYLQVFRTNGRGWGCRTLKNISKGTFVCEYAGELITDEEANRREDDSYLFDLDTQDEETYCIDASKFGNVSRFINHLCEPNVKPVKVFVDHHDLRFPRICFFASKDIKAFDELGFDYGYKFWSIKWKQFTCTCGSRSCKYSTDTILQTIEEYSNASPSSASLSQNVLDDVRDH